MKSYNLRQKHHVLVVKKFISIAEHLYSLNNYNTLAEIISGLSHFTVLRFKYLWGSLPTRVRLLLDEFNEMMSPKQNYKNYRALEQTKDPSDAPVFPNIAVYLRDITYAYDGNPDFLDEESNEKCHNFVKIRLIGSLISRLLQYAKHPFRFPVNHQIRTYLLNVESYDEETLYKRSVACEPAKQTTTSSSLSSSDDVSGGSFDYSLSVINESPLESFSDDSILFTRSDSVETINIIKFDSTSRLSSKTNSPQQSRSQTLNRSCLIPRRRSNPVTSKTPLSRSNQGCSPVTHLRLNETTGV
eukprot:TRINITY_DN733_c0_g1_i2.p1 TRINITY_DN733_c0_g1~~TRINITY_DN733_c0_g1_i2.p1  ORF type:complete len:300 (+),score=48.08 TRINITY_DN733_c0_g1_i2:720-1619(+)